MIFHRPEWFETLSFAISIFVSLISLEIRNQRLIENLKYIFPKDYDTNKFKFVVVCKQIWVF